MLVLSRHRDESIMIGDDVVVTIVDIRGDKVRLGIAAPQDIPVHRQEVYEAIKRENQRAGKLEPSDTKQSSPGGGPSANDDNDSGQYRSSVSPLTRSLDHYDPFSAEAVSVPRLARTYGKVLTNYVDQN